MHIITLKEMRSFVKKHWVSNIIKEIEKRLKYDYSHWNNFKHSVRYAHYIKQWAIELMPVGNDEYFSYKYVNGHPDNVKIQHPSVMWIGQLSECKSWEPVLLSEMTLLTALRTAATTSFVASFFPCKNARHLAIIGNGSQSIFQSIAICETHNIQKISHYDIDHNMMKIYKEHIGKLYPNIEIISACSSNICAHNADIIITVTEAFGKQQVVKKDDIKKWACIFAIGWDCPNKTELDPEILKYSSIVVEYEAQTRKEWEMQNFSNGKVFANLHQLTKGDKILNKEKSDFYVFDGVGIWIEDYSALQVMYKYVKQWIIWEFVDLVPQNMKNTKDLYWSI